MHISIIGTGNMAHGIGTRVLAGGHFLKIFHKDENKAEALAQKLGDEVKSEKLGTTISGDVVILALPYQAIHEIVKEYKDSLSGKIVVDISNPVNFETFELIPPADSSGAEEIAKLLPNDAKLVKAFNTTFAGTLLAGEVAGEKLDVFIASDDKDAAETVAKIADDGGLRGLYVGPLKRARALEGMQLIQMSLQEKLSSNWMSALKLLSHT